MYSFLLPLSLNDAVNGVLNDAVCIVKGCLLFTPIRLTPTDQVLILWVSSQLGFAAEKLPLSLANRDM